MKTDTAFAAAFKRSGMDTDSALLYNIAVDLLRKNNVDPKKCINAFVGEVRDAGGIMAALVSYEVTRNVALAYLDKVAADMRGSQVPGGVRMAGDNLAFPGATGTEVSPQGEGSVRWSVESHQANGASHNSEGAGVRGRDESRSLIGPSSSQPNRNGAARNASGLQQAGGRVVPMPNPPRGIEALRAVHKEAGPSLFQTYMIRGRAIGDLRFGELAELAALGRREAAVLKLIMNHAQVHSGSVRVRDVIKESDLQRMIAQAAEMSDAA